MHFIVFFQKVLKFVLAQRFVVRLVVDQLVIFKDYFKLCQSVPRIAFYAVLAAMLSLDPSGVSVDCPSGTGRCCTLARYVQTSPSLL